MSIVSNYNYLILKFLFNYYWPLVDWHSYCSNTNQTQSAKMIRLLIVTTAYNPFAGWIQIGIKHQVMTVKNNMFFSSQN